MYALPFFEFEASSTSPDDDVSPSLLSEFFVNKCPYVRDALPLLGSYKAELDSSLSADYLLASPTLF